VIEKNLLCRTSHDKNLTAIKLGQKHLKILNQ